MVAIVLWCVWFRPRLIATTTTHVVVLASTWEYGPLTQIARIELAKWAPRQWTGAVSQAIGGEGHRGECRTAFGPPEDYARAWATPMTARQRWRCGLRSTAVVAGAAGSGAVLAEGALAAGRGTTVLGVNGWWVVGLAGLALVAVIAAAPTVRVLDPRTGRPRAVGRDPLLLGAGAVLLVTVVLLVMTGAWTAAAS